MLNVFYSNRIEALALQLSVLVKHHPLPVFDKEFILVESSAMSQWLSQQIAMNNGIAANIEFPFPASLLWQIYRSQQPNLPKCSRYDRQPLTWRLYDDFKHQTLRQRNPSIFEKLTQYIGQLSDDRQLFGFAEYIAGLFDQYQIYRPEMLLRWSQQLTDNPDEWQAAIWYYLRQDIQDEPDRSTIFRDSMTLPLTLAHISQFKRLQIFALSTLPKPYMDIIAKMAEVIEVNLFVLNPCAVFWADIKSRRDLNESDDVEEENNDLLSMMAKQGRDYIRLLLDYHFHEESEAFVDADPISLLMFLQQDMLYLRQKAPTEDKIQLQLSDNSLVFHACHSRLREVQVVKNQILLYLEHNPSCRLDEIAIMVPSLENYSAYFYSIFQTSDNPLPFHLAERRSLEKTSIKTALLQLFLIKEKQFSRSFILDILRIPMINEKFGLEDLSLIEQLLDQLQVHFGLKDTEWSMMGPEVVSMAWQQAKDRLIKSYCLPSDASSELVMGVDEQAAITLGRLCEFIDRLAILQELDADRPAEQWCCAVDCVLDAFFQSNEALALAEIREIRGLLEDWLDQVNLGSFNSPLSFPVFYKTLEVKLENAASQHYFRQDMINIATLLPMRSLPFQKICLLGMNDGEYPNVLGNDPLDIMKQHPQPGDRNRQHEERYLFLEAILAARKKVHISYIGKSHIDNTERFPSLLVAELLDYLNRGYSMEGVDALKDRLLINHPLQAFDQSYFMPNDQLIEPIQSVDKALLRQSQALLVSDRRINQYSSQLVFDSTDSSIRTLANVIHAVVEPQKWFLKRNNIYCNHNASDDGNVELMATNGLHHYLLLQQLLLDKRQGNPFSTLKSCCQRGWLPQGRMGWQTYQYYCEMADRLMDKMHNFDLFNCTESIYIHKIFGDVAIEDTVMGLSNDNSKRLSWVGEKIQGKQVLSAWIQHVALQAETQLPLSSYLLSDSETLVLQPVDLSLCQHLIIDWIGYMNQASQELVHFFVRAGWQYQLALLAKPDTAMKILEDTLYGNARFPGEWHQEAIQFAYRGVEPLDIDAIINPIDRLYKPMIQHMERLEQ